MMPQNEAPSIRKMRWLLFLMGLVKIPMIGFVCPRLVVINDDMAEVRIRLRRRTKNHLNSMYFGVLSVGADVAGGLHAFYFAAKHGKRISFAFKSFHADFLKRAESDVTFRSREGRVVEQVIEESIRSGERINREINVEAFDANGETVARFTLTISVKSLD